MMDLQRLHNSANRGHSRRVSAISGLLAERAGYPQAESRMIALAAQLHDCGKSEIPAHVLYKPSVLTPSEYGMIKTHTTIGYRLLSEAARILTAAAFVAGHHHERMDGAGYHNLSGHEIHPYARLVACADVFDALYSRRTYKKPWDMAKIRAFFAEQSGKQFDPILAALLFNGIDEVLSLYRNG